jgi:hypothetical protein
MLSTRTYVERGVAFAELALGVVDGLEVRPEAVEPLAGQVARSHLWEKCTLLQLTCKQGDKIKSPNPYFSKLIHNFFSKLMQNFFFQN